VTTRCKATWKFNGAEMSIGFDDDVCEIPVNPNNGTAVDQVLGKVERKFRKRVIERIAGCACIPADGEAAEASQLKTVEATVLSPSRAIAESLSDDKSAKDLLSEMFVNDCDGNKLKMEAVVEEFAKKKTMRGSTPAEYQALWDRLKPEGTERESYEKSIMALMG